MALSYTLDTWKSDMALAKAVGIDAFALNVATPLNGDGGCAGQISNAFQAAEESGFKVFLMFDYLGGTQGAWPASDIQTVLTTYASRPGMFKYNNAPLVSTFEGGDHIDDWAGIRAAVSGGISFLPCFMGLGPSGVSSNIDKIDGFFSWDMWPHGPTDSSTSADSTWRAAIDGKAYMMGVSPWFYTKLPGYGKAWVWRGDDLWHDRWQEAASFAPEIVQIVTWNDYGESHYVGPIYDAGIPSGDGTNAHPYVDNMPHEAWRQLLPFYINQYKTGSTQVADEKLVYWYRLTPAANGDADGVTGNNCPSPINKYPSDSTCYPPGEIEQDKIFFTALVKEAPATVTVKVGDSPVTSYPVTSPGVFHASQDFAGQTGFVTFQLTRGDQVVLTGDGQAILASPPDGITNWNAWVGAAS